MREAAGDRFDDIELNVRAFFVAVTNERNATAAGVAAMIGFDADDVLATPFALIGTPAQIADDLRERRERWGFSYVIVGAEDVDAFAPVVAELRRHLSRSRRRAWCCAATASRGSSGRRRLRAAGGALDAWRRPPRPSPMSIRRLWDAAGDPTWQG